VKIATWKVAPSIAGKSANGEFVRARFSWRRSERVWRELVHVSSAFLAKKSLSRYRHQANLMI
jgi:hypothetical protein